MVKYTPEQSYSDKGQCSHRWVKRSEVRAGAVRGQQLIRDTVVGYSNGCQGMEGGASVSEL